MKSNCCYEEIKINCADEGTCCYICSKCNRACDPAINIKGVSQWKNEGEKLGYLDYFKEEFIKRFWDDFLRMYYCQHCDGCKDGHSSFWKTIIESDYWFVWKEHNKQMNWDFAECEELGILSKEHFLAFINFIKKL